MLAFAGNIGEDGVIELAVTQTLGMAQGLKILM
jgi:hypothetical protein